MANNFQHIAPGFFRLALKSGLRIKVEVIENNRFLHTLVGNFGDDRVLVPYEDIVVALPAAA